VTYLYDHLALVPVSASAPLPPPIPSFDHRRTKSSPRSNRGFWESFSPREKDHDRSEVVSARDNGELRDGTTDKDKESPRPKRRLKRKEERQTKISRPKIEFSEVVNKSPPRRGLLDFFSPRRDLVESTESMRNYSDCSDSSTTPSLANSTDLEQTPKQVRPESPSEKQKRKS